MLASRDELDPDLDTELLIAVIDAEADAAGDGDKALRDVEAAISAALERGVGRVAPDGSAGSAILDRARDQGDES